VDRGNATEADLALRDPFAGDPQRESAAHGTRVAGEIGIRHFKVEVMERSQAVGERPGDDRDSLRHSVHAGGNDLLQLGLDLDAGLHNAVDGDIISETPVNIPGRLCCTNCGICVIHSETASASVMSIQDWA